MLSRTVSRPLINTAIRLATWKEAEATLSHRSSAALSAMLNHGLCCLQDPCGSTRHFSQQNKEQPIDAAAPEANDKKTAADEKLKTDKRVSSDDLAQALQLLQDENDKFREDCKEFKDKWLRELANNENLRKRLDREVETARQYGIQSLCKDMLEVPDIMEKAVESVPAEALAANKQLKDLFEGLKMTHTVLMKTMNKHGLTRISPEGEKFDPGFHEALMEVPNQDKDPGTVEKVLTVGYVLNGRPVRAAQVVVTRK